MGSGPVPQMHGRELIRGMGLLLEETKALVPALAEARPPDLVVHDGTLAWWGRILAHRWRVPAVETWPNFVSNRHWSMNRYAKINPLSPCFLATMLRVARYLRSEGITDVGGFFQGASAARRIVTIPRCFQPAGETFTDGYAFVGPALTDRAFQAEWTPPGDGTPVLLVSLGTAYNDRPDFYRMLVDSAADRPWHVVMAVGDVDPDELGAVPHNVEVHSQVPQLAVLRHAHAFVTHAGMGGTMEGLYHRVPMVALPQMAEQRANADRLVELGLGLRIDPGGTTPEALWDAVDEVVADPRVHERIEGMRERMDAAGGAQSAADEIEDVLDRC
ncbi:macrolide family glycosyltransferase [Streptomonospora alba]|uniref:macrolide family glycosyltransferase n=1 Tax=Streptomonospora alba TaxID=183763 RepID=UPI00069B34E4|nr:macrolide family glycosyltransferase [Streptomonospora alba]